MFGRTRNAVRTRATDRAFLSSPKLSWVFLQLDRNTENMFSISFRKHHDKKEGKQLVNFDYQNVNFICLRYHYVNSFVEFCGFIKL